MNYFSLQNIDVQRVLPIRGRKSDNDFKSLVTSLEINDAIILRA